MMSWDAELGLPCQRPRGRTLYFSRLEPAQSLSLFDPLQLSSHVLDPCGSTNNSPQFVKTASPPSRLDHQAMQLLHHVGCFLRAVRDSFQYVDTACCFIASFRCNMSPCIASNAAYICSKGSLGEVIVVGPNRDLLRPCIPQLTRAFLQQPMGDRVG